MACNMRKGTNGYLRKLSSRMTIYDYIRFCAKVNLLKTEKNTYKNGKCRFRLACADYASRSETTLYASARMTLFARCKLYTKRTLVK